MTPSNNFFNNFSTLVYNNTIISLMLIVYYLIIANSVLHSSFANYQTIYDSLLRDNCKLYDLLSYFYIQYSEIRSGFFLGHLRTLSSINLQHD